MMRIAPALAAFLLAAIVAQIAAADVPDRLEQAFRRWTAEVAAPRAVLTIWRGGVRERDVAIGMAPRKPVGLASLSKAVTAVCAARMIDTGVWSAKTTSREVLKFGPPGLTVAALMTHSAGLGPDQTQALMPLWLDTRPDRAPLATEIALKRAAQTARRGKYSYNNENYAILGQMIAARTGRAYAPYCKKLVLDPAGVTTARLSPRLGGMGPFGGWQMSVQDYARFMHWAYGPRGLIGANPARWPRSAMGGGAFYGVGMIQRRFRGGMNYWHFGAACFPGRLNLGSYAVRWLREWSVVVAYDACVDGAAMGRLDHLLSRAVFR